VLVESLAEIDPRKVAEVVRRFRHKNASATHFFALSKTHRDFARNVQGLVFSCHLFHSIIPLLAIFSRIGILAIAIILRSRNLNLIEQKVKLAFFDPMGVMLKTVGNYTSFLGNIVSYRPWLSTAAA